MVTDIDPGSDSSAPRYLTNVNGTLFFTANDGTHGDELWKSDGTATGTLLVKDTNPGIANIYPDNLTNIDGTLYFRGNDGVHGYELWKSDGTADGTAMVEDINPGNANAYPKYLTNINGTLFFSANDAVHGAELWKLVPLVLGDVNRDGRTNPDDILALTNALTDLNELRTANGLSSADLLAIADTNDDGHVDNLDVQGLLSLLNRGGILSGGASPTTSTLTLTRPIFERTAGLNESHPAAKNSIHDSLLAEWPAGPLVAENFGLAVARTGTNFREFTLDAHPRAGAAFYGGRSRRVTDLPDSPSVWAMVDRIPLIAANQHRVPARRGACIVLGSVRF